MPVALFVFTTAILLALIANFANSESKRKKKAKLEYKPLTKIRSFANIQEAQIAKSLLQANNIDAYVLHDNAYGGGTALSVQLKVNSQDKEEALELLENLK